jgi:hypothetical protein
MFCTLKQAADRLQTTEAEIETLLDDGLLREFRDGGNRLVTVSDLAALAAQLCPAGTDHPARRPTTRSGPVSHEFSAAREITLPPTPAAVPGIRRPSPEARSMSRQPTGSNAEASRGMRTARKPSSSPPRSARPGRAPHAARERATRRKPHASAGSTVAFTPQRPRPQTQELSLRQWIWMGLLDDRPHTILILFAAILLAACTLIGAVYLLTQIL